MSKITEKVLKVLVILMFLCTVYFCVNPKILYSEIYTIEDKVYYDYDKIIGNKQLDSLCIADTLSRDLNKWFVMPFYDDETKEKIDIYVYVKKMDKSSEIVYRLRQQEDTLYRITKRIRVKNE